jgi:hypothetical protein
MLSTSPSSLHSGQGDDSFKNSDPNPRVRITEVMSNESKGGKEEEKGTEKGGKGKEKGAEKGERGKEKEKNKGGNGKEEIKEKRGKVFFGLIDGENSIPKLNPKPNSTSSLIPDQLSSPNHSLTPRELLKDIPRPSFSVPEDYDYTKSTG